MVLCLESEHQKWLKNSEGSLYTNVLFLLPLFPCFFDFAVGSTAILWTSAIYLVLCFEYDCDVEIILMASSLEAELVNFPHATVWFQRTDLRAWCAHAHTRIWMGRKTWIQKSTEHYTASGDVTIHSSGFHLGVILSLIGHCFHCHDWGWGQLLASNG